MKLIKTNYCVLLLLLAASSVWAETNDLTLLLQRGLFEEQANRNLPAAISNYQVLAAKFDHDRQLAATAVFRLGECYRLEGKTNEAVAQYQRILRDFSDDTALVTVSRQNLTGLGISAALTNITTSPADTLQRQQIQQAIKSLEENLAARQKQMTNDPSPNGLLSVQQKLGELKRLLSGTPSTPSDDLASDAPTYEEEHEIRRIQQMIQNSPDLINAVSQGGILPLRNAARNGWIKVATFLLDHGAEINRSQLGSTPLQDAAQTGNRAMAELLLNRGAEIDASDSGGDTALHYAAEHGFQAVITVLLASHAKVDALNRRQETPFFLAAQNGQAGVVQMLLAAEANPNLKNHFGSTALEAAIKIGSTKSVNVLLAAKADPNLQDNSGRSPLSYAAEAASPEIVKALLQAGADVNGGNIDLPLLCAIFKQDMVSTELLLRAGANPNGRTAWNLSTLYTNVTTPLFLAISTHQLQPVDLLLKFKADPNDSQSPSMTSVFQALPDTNILVSLLKAGAKVDAISPNSEQWTPLCAAVPYGPDAVRILLQYGANPNFCNSRNLTPLHYEAYGRADRQVFELLLAAKADPNVRADNGKTPLGILQDRLHQPSLTPEDKPKLESVIDLLHQHGALDRLPDWDHLTVSRPSAGISQTVFQKESNDWNHFSLLKTIFNHYEAYGGLPVKQGNSPLFFPDLTRIEIIRPHHDSTNETRISVNLLNGTNGIDCSKDVPLEFGDVVQIPEYDHSLSAPRIGLTENQHESVADCLKGTVLLLVHGQKIELAIYPTVFGSTISAVLNLPEAQKHLLASSDLSRVKVSRNDPKSGKKQEWIVRCKRPSSEYNSNDLWLRDGDVIEVPEKP